MNNAIDILRQRSRRLNDKPVMVEGREYILCWLQQALRAEQNPAIDAAIALGNEHDLPIVVYHGLDNRYPHASYRLHRFILEASQSLGEDIATRNLRFCRYVRRPEKLEKGLVYRLCERAAALVTDDMPTFVARWQADKVASQIDCTMLAVDASCLVPMNAFPTLLDATKSFRAAHTPQRDKHLMVDLTQTPSHEPFDGDLCFDSDDIQGLSSADLDELIARCDVDMTLPPAPHFGGTRQAALNQLAYAIEYVVPNYKFRRNNPADPNSTSRISPWMHFGVLSPREVAQQVKESSVHSAAKWKFLDEALTWREYYHHLARFADDPASYENVPAWGRETLADHATDERPVLYTRKQLARGETNDETWNAAQKQFLLDGWMHNNLRMYWVKQFIKWCATPEEAWEMACLFNDRFSLDGRDPVTYGSIQWGFGRSKKAYRENPIYGWVPPKSDRALRKRAGAAEWLAEYAARPVFDVYFEDENSKVENGKVENNEYENGEKFEEIESMTAHDQKTKMPQ